MLETGQKQGIPLLPLESAFLDSAIRSFVKGLSDFDVKREAARGLSSPARSFYSVYSITEKTRQAKVEVSKLAYTEANEFYSKQVDFLWGFIRGTTLPSEEKEIAYETLCDLSGSEQVDYLWGVVRDTSLHTEVKELVYNTLWDMENWSIQSTPPVQPLIVPSTSQIQSVPRAQYPPTQPTSLVQADLTILPPPTKSVPFVEPVMLAQPSLIEPAPLPVQPISSIIKPALPSQTVGPSLPALPLVEPIPCALAAFQSILPSFESVPPATIEPDAPTLSIVQEASDMQILTEQNIEENKAVYNQECFRFIAGIFTTNEARSRPELARAQ